MSVTEATEQSDSDYRRTNLGLSQSDICFGHDQPPHHGSRRLLAYEAPSPVRRDRSRSGPRRRRFPCALRSNAEPGGEAVPDVDALVAEKTVNLFDRMLGHQTARLRQRLPNHRNGQRRAGHHTQRRVRQGYRPLLHEGHAHTGRQ
jgi:hypothetical protein